MQSCKRPDAFSLFMKFASPEVPLMFGHCHSGNVFIFNKGTRKVGFGP